MAKRNYTYRIIDKAKVQHCRGLMVDQPSYETGQANVQSLAGDHLQVRLEHASSTHTRGELKKMRKVLLPLINQAFEKARTNGTRGWRQHAIKTPIFVRDRKSSKLYMDFDVKFLDNTVTYSRKASAVSLGAIEYTIAMAGLLAEVQKLGFTTAKVKMNGAAI